MQTRHTKPFNDYVSLTDSQSPNFAPQTLIQHLSTPNSSSSTNTAGKAKRKRKRQIMDIATWVQLYSTYMLILYLPSTLRLFQNLYRATYLSSRSPGNSNTPPGCATTLSTENGLPQHSTKSCQESTLSCIPSHRPR